MKPGSTGVRIKYSLTGIESNETLVFVHGREANLRQFELWECFFASIAACCWHPCVVTAAHQRILIKQWWN